MAGNLEANAVSLAVVKVVAGVRSLAVEVLVPAVKLVGGDTVLGGNIITTAISSGNDVEPSTVGIGLVDNAQALGLGIGSRDSTGRGSVARGLLGGLFLNGGFRNRLFLGGLLSGSLLLSSLLLGGGLFGSLLLLGKAALGLGAGSLDTKALDGSELSVAFLSGPVLAGQDGVQVDFVKIGGLLAGETGGDGWIKCWLRNKLIGRSIVILTDGLFTVSSRGNAGDGKGGSRDERELHCRYRERTGVGLRMSGL